MAAAKQFLRVTESRASAAQAEHQLRNDELRRKPVGFLFAKVQDLEGPDLFPEPKLAGQGFHRDEATIQVHILGHFGFHVKDGCFFLSVAHDLLYTPYWCICKEKNCTF